MHATERAGTATRDSAQDFLLDDRDRLGMFLQVCRYELPQGIRDRRHGAPATLLQLRHSTRIVAVFSGQLAEHLVDDIARVGLGGLGQVQVDHGGL